MKLATYRSKRMKRRKAGIYNSRHVKGNEELEVRARILGGLVRASNLAGLPAVGSNIEREGVNAVIMGEPDVVQPSILGVGEGVSHHMVGSHNLVIASPLNDYRNGIARRSGKWRVELDRNLPKSHAYQAIEEWGQPQRGGPVQRRK
jgi:hypothetical protein